MLPHDTPNEDWNLYFNETYMRHISKGPVFIQIRPHDEDGHAMFRCYTIGKGGVLSKRGYSAESADLRIYWPRPGAYNLPDHAGAIFVGRQAQRHMKRSAYKDHYYIIWNDEVYAVTMGGNPYNGNKLLPLIMNPEPYGRIVQFRKSPDSVRSTALSPKIILQKKVGTPSKLLNLIYMSEEVGELDEEDNFVSAIHLDSRTRRITEHLKTLGVQVP